MALTNVDLDRIDGNSGTLANVNTSSINGGPLAGLRNQIINGAMLIAQRGDGPITGTVTTGEFLTVDRFTVDDVTASRQTVDSLPGFAYSLAISAGGRYLIRQPIELDGTGSYSQFAPGSTWTVSLYSTVGAKFEAGFAANHTNASYGEVLAQAQMTEEVINAQWKRLTLSFTVPAGLSLNAGVKCLNAQFHLDGPGEITGVQLEPGPVATPFEHRPIGTELALCQRYYESVRIRGTVLNVNSSSGSSCPLILQCSPKRSTPTIEDLTALSIVKYVGDVAVDMNISSVTYYGEGSHGLTINMSRKSATAAQDLWFVDNGLISLVAEL